MNNSVQTKYFYTVDEVRATLGPILSRCALYKLVRNGEIPTVTIGPRKYITAGWVDQLIQQSSRTEVPKNG